MTTIHDLEAEAQAELVRQAHAHRWTFFVRLSWAIDVSESRAADHLEQWATRLRERLPGAVVLVGQHSDSSPMPWSSFLLTMPRTGDPLKAGPAGSREPSINSSGRMAISGSIAFNRSAFLTQGTPRITGPHGT